MPDPISPLGSSGQSPIATSVATSSAISSDVSGKAGGVAAQASSGLASQAVDHVQLEVVPKAQQKPESRSLETPSLEESVQEFRDFLKNLPSDLQFRTDQESGMVVYKVINPVTREVLRQYPAEEIVTMARRLRAMEADGQKKAGIFLDEHS